MQRQSQFKEEMQAFGRRGKAAHTQNFQNHAGGKGGRATDCEQVTRIPQLGRVAERRM